MLSSSSKIIVITIITSYMSAGTTRFMTIIIHDLCHYLQTLVNMLDIVRCNSECSCEKIFLLCVLTKHRLAALLFVLVAAVDADELLLYALITADLLHKHQAFENTANKSSAKNALEIVRELVLVLVPVS